MARQDTRPQRLRQVKSAHDFCRSAGKNLSNRIPMLVQDVLDAGRTLGSDVLSRPVQAPAPAASVAPSATDAPTPEMAALSLKSKKEKKPATNAANGPAADSGPALFARAQLQVVKVLTVDDIASDKLYKTTIDIGGGQTRRVVAGLKKHVERDVLLGSLAVAILNLKPAKLAGEASEAMLLAADAPLEGGAELVKVLVPPEGSAVGDPVFLEGSSPAAEYPKVLKSGPWKDIITGLSVQGSRATFEGQALVTLNGAVTVPEMPDGAGIH